MMEWRDAAFDADGRITCEIRHPAFGWIPFTADPADAEAPFDVAALDAEIRASGEAVPYVTPRAAMQLTRRQVLTGLVLEGLITGPEALAPASVPPAAIETLFAAMPDPQQTIARITWANFTVAYRLDPLIPVIAAAATPPLDDAALDAFFTAYAAV